MAILTVSGLDARAFLQGQLTCDLKLLTPTHPLRGAHCNLKGRVEALYDLFSAGDEILLKTPDDVAEHALQHLQPYARFSKVKLSLTMDHAVVDPAARIAEIQAKHVRLHPETVGRFLPQELALVEAGAVSFNKGCYLGQEIVARLHYLGQLKRVLVYRQGEKGSQPDFEWVDGYGKHQLGLVEQCGV